MARSNAIGKMREIADDIESDPKVLLLAKLGNLKKQIVLHSQVLVAGYIRPGKTKGGIYLTDKAVEEDRFQGNIGMVVAMGKGAFKDDNIAKFNGDKLKIGDWVMYQPADGIGLFIREVPCRLFQDTRILMKVSDPEIYY